MGNFGANYGVNYDTSGVVISVIDSGFVPKRRVVFQDENIVIPTEIIIKTEEKIRQSIGIILKYLHRYQIIPTFQYENKIETHASLKRKHRTTAQNILKLSEKTDAPKIRIDVDEKITANPVIRRRKEKLLNYLLFRRFRNA